MFFSNFKTHIVKEVMSIMTGSLEKFSLPYMKQMAFTESLTEYKTAIKALEGPTKMNGSLVLLDGLSVDMTKNKEIKDILT